MDVTQGTDGWGFGGVIRGRNRRDRKVHGRGVKGERRDTEDGDMGEGWGWRRDVDDGGKLENG